MRTLHVISPTPWIGDAFRQGLTTRAVTSASGSAPQSADIAISEDDGEQWRVLTHHIWDSPVAVSDAVAPDDALWIAPPMLVAFNALRQHRGQEPWRFRGPDARWLDGAPQSLTGRHTAFVTVRELRGWRQLPRELGSRPWSQLCAGRVEGFNAARRDLPTLLLAVHDAPETSLIALDEHLPGISEEWNVVLHHGQVIASSGYCVHTPPDSHGIITVFDMDPAHRYDGAAADLTGGQPLFHESYRTRAETAAQALATLVGVGSASVLVAFRGQDDPPVVLEATPLWCSAPYPYDGGAMRALATAISESRVRTADTRHTTGNGDSAISISSALPPGAEQEVPFAADPWMVRQYRNRYVGASDMVSGL